MKFKKTCLLISFHDKNSYSEETSYFPEITRLQAIIFGTFGI